MRLSFAVKLAAAAAVAVAVAMIAATKAIDFERYKGYLADLVQAETGRKLTFSGPVRLRLGLVPSLIAEGVSLSNIDGGSRADMIHIDRVEAEVALPALLRKEILIQRLIISSPDLLLEKGNWTLTGNGKEQSAGTPTRFNLRELKIKNAKVTWVEGANRQSVAIHKLTMLPEQGANAGLGVTVVGDTLGKMFEFSGKVGNVGAALAGKPWPVTLKGAMPGTILSLDGSIGNLPAFSGLDLKLGFQADEGSEILRLAGLAVTGPLGPMRVSARLGDAGGTLGISDLDASAGRRDSLFLAIKGSLKDVRGFTGLEASVQAEADNLTHVGRLLALELPPVAAVKFGATLRDEHGGWTASDLKLHVGGSDVSGEVVWQTGKRPKLKATLAATRLAVADFAAKSGHGSEDGRLIPVAPLPVELLRAYDAELLLKADKLILSALTLNTANVEARLQKGVLTVEPLHAALGGGTVDGALTLDTRPAQPQAGLRLTAAGVDVGRVLREASSEMLTGGIGEAVVTLKAHGPSLRALVASASGQVRLNVGPGRVNNRAFAWAGGDLPSQLLGTLNPLAQSRETSELSCAVVNFRLKNGLAATDKGIAVQTEGVDVVGAGTIDLRDEGLDLGFTPRAKEGLGLSLGGQFSGFTRLRGTLAAPALSVDELGAARGALSMGAAAATAGLSLLGELLLDKVTADSEPCRTALSMGAPTPAAKGGRGGSLLDGLFGR